MPNESGMEYGGHFDHTQSQCAKERPTIADLSMLVARLVQQIRRHEPKNNIAEKAMDYLRRKDLCGSILRESLNRE